MRLFYCPMCGKEEIRNDNPYNDEKTIVNMRDGYGRPITHYKCECGNYLAGSMSVSGFDEHTIKYYKDIIKGYNEGGCYYNTNSALNGDNIDLSERAKRCYEQRKKDAEKLKAERVARFLKEVHWFEQCDKNADDKCEHGHCKYSKFVLGENAGIFCNRKI